MAPLASAPSSSSGSPRRLAPFAPLRRRLLALALAGLAAGAGLSALSAFTGCTAEPPPVAPKPCDVQVITLNLYAADNINPNDNGNPRPVVVRLYQLRNDVRMENATYDEILLKVDDLSVFPNDLVQVKFERIKDASVLAGVALFHSPKGTSWKTFYGFPLPPGEAQCGGRASDAGKPEADPKTAFFLESTKIDNGSQFDESMFPDAGAVRKVDLPKRSAAPEAPAATPGR